MVAGFKGDGAAVRCEFHCVAQNIHQHLPDANGVGQHIGLVRLGQIGAELDIPIGQEAIHDAQNRIGHCRDVNGSGHKFDAAAFDAADVQNIVDEGQQMVGAFGNLGQAVSNLRLGLMLHSDVGEAHNGIHGGANVVGHVVQEDGLCPVRVLRSTDSILQLLLDLPVAGAVGHIQDVFFLPPDITAEGNHMEPAHLPGFLMDVFPVPFQLPTRQNLVQVIQHMGGGVAG